MNAQNVWVRLRRRERVRERTKSISSLGPSISIETNLFRSINIYPILFSHLIAGHVSWLRVASTTNGAGEYEIFTVCCHNKIAVKSIWMRTMEITISWSRRSSESFAPRLKRIWRYICSRLRSVYRIECDSNRIVATLRFYLRRIYVCILTFLICANAVNEANRMLDAFFMPHHKQQQKINSQTEERNRLQSTARLKRWLDTNIVTQKYTNKLWNFMAIIKVETVAVVAAVASS